MCVGCGGTGTLSGTPIRTHLLRPVGVRGIGLFRRFIYGDGSLGPKRLQSSSSKGLSEKGARGECLGRVLSQVKGVSGNF